MNEYVYIGLGSNLAQPVEQLQQALTALGEIPHTTLCAHSSLYTSKPLGPADQPDFVNAVALLETTLEPHALLDHLQRIEQEQGRTRKAERWGPRTLDLDILLFGDRILNDERLTVPHYHMHARAFALYPLAELTPDLVLPTGEPLSQWLAACPRGDLQMLDKR